MIRTNNPNQTTFIDPCEEMGPKRKKMPKKSWAYFFRHHILPELPVERVGKHFSSFGRPSKELYTSLGVMLLRQTFDMTDQETLAQLAFDSQWHYALNIVFVDDDSAYMCEKTLYNSRNIILQNNLWDILFDRVTDSPIQKFGVDTSRQRLDSTHIKSNMRSLGRIGIFSRTIHKFLSNLKRRQRALFDRLPKRLVSKYTKKEQLSAFSMVKPSESQKTLKSLTRDLYQLIRQFEHRPNVRRFNSFILLQRVFSEQCRIVRKGNDANHTAVAAEPIPSKRVSSDSLQNPSDPDATCDGHKGKGYRVQVMETWSEDKTPDQPNPIACVAVETAHRHDSKAVVPAIEATERRGVKPKELPTDSLYGSDDNVQHAKRQGVTLISPALKGAGKTDTLRLGDFRFDGKNRIAFCRNDRQPISQRIEKDVAIAEFNPAHCQSCPLRSKCPVKDSKENTYIRHTAKEVRLARRRQYEGTTAFIEKYAFRAGVEATMSEFKQVTGVNRLRVRGLKAVSFCATLKALGLNILRSAKAFFNLNGCPTRPCDALLFHDRSLLSVVSQGLLLTHCLIATILRLRFNFLGYYLRPN